MNLQINGIIAKQYISPKSGKSTVTVVDLDTGSSLDITLSGVVLDQATVDKKLPRKMVFTGAELRAFGDKRYLTASDIADVKAS